VADRKSPSPPVRGLILAWIALYIGWWWICPWIVERQGSGETAAWTSLFLLPTLISGAPVGVMLLLKPNPWTALMFGIFSAVHVAFGLGFALARVQG
jgi:hypothetical protein